MDTTEIRTIDVQEVRNRKAKIQKIFDKREYREKEFRILLLQHREILKTGKNIPPSELQQYRQRFFDIISGYYKDDEFIQGHEEELITAICKKRNYLSREDATFLLEKSYVKVLKNIYSELKGSDEKSKMFIRNKNGVERTIFIEVLFAALSIDQKKGKISKRKTTLFTEDELGHIEALQSNENIVQPFKNFSRTDAILVAPFIPILYDRNDTRRFVMKYKQDIIEAAEFTYKHFEKTDRDCWVLIKLVKKLCVNRISAPDDMLINEILNIAKKYRRNNRHGNHLRKKIASILCSSKTPYDARNLSLMVGGIDTRTVKSKISIAYQVFANRLESIAHSSRR